MSASNPGTPARARPRSSAQAEDAAAMQAIRRIIHAVDLHSRKVARGTGLTLPQLVVLQAIEQLGEVTSTALSERVALTPATVTTIVDNLEERALAERYRSGQDRRVVHLRLTPRGRTLLASVPRPLHRGLLARFAALPAERRHGLLTALVEVAELLGPGDAGPEISRMPKNGRA